MAAIFQSQKSALITGAASGVGFAIARLCRSKGMHLALLDIDTANLEKAKNELSALDSSVKTEVYTIDVGNGDAWKDVTKQIRSTFNDLDLIVLNAGKSYKAESELAGRLKPWADADYWKKVSSSPSAYLAIADETDIRHQRIWSSERPRNAPSADDCLIANSQINRNHRLEARNH
jgi:NAD(P)-dependent dehydrogenase (short-subunit alcohol dehydrogenase family)